MQTNLETSLEYTSKSLHFTELGKIESIDAETMTVNVRIYNIDVTRDSSIAIAGKDGALLTGVPFVCLTGGKATNEMPINAGDDCVVFYNDFKYRNWINSRSIGIDMSDDFHTRSNPIALVGVSNPYVASKRLEPYSVTDWVMRNGKKAKITIGLNEVSIVYGAKKIMVSDAGISIINTETGTGLESVLTDLIDTLVTSANTQNIPFNDATKQKLNETKVKLKEVLKDG